MKWLKGGANRPWLAATLLAQTGWGAYPVLARYLQTISKLPSMSIIAVGSLLALAVLVVFFRAELDWKRIRSKRLFFFAVIVVGRGVTNFLAARYTLAIYVQLITLLTPFLVAILSMMVLGERLPRYTGSAITLSVAGAMMIMSSTLVQGDDGASGQDSHLLGISLAVVSSLLLATYMIAVRGSVRQEINGETLLLVQLMALGLATGILSLLLGEQWSQWGDNDTLDWLVFGLLSLGILAGANIAQIGAIRHLGAALVSSTMSWRLVSALVLAALLLDEHLTSIVQVLGVLLVLTTITWYLWQQRSSGELRATAP